ncbi:MAG: regulatory protein RecX [Bacteroidales bacterium]|jgi:regulatory protein|nr:regulatory protein RecX [Bacteroidales bacterium]
MEKVLDKMRNLCSRREYCRSEIMKKALDALDGDRSKAEHVVDVLTEEKYIDELRYASAFARDKASLSGWGEVKIRYMLSSKRIPKDVIDMAVKEIDGAKAEARLLKLMESKFRTLKDDPQCRIKMIRFGLGRGYGYEEVADVLDSLMSN